MVNALYPSLTTIVGAKVDGRPNFLAVAHVGIMNHGIRSTSPSGWPRFITPTGASTPMVSSA